MTSCRPSSRTVWTLVALLAVAAAQPPTPDSGGPTPIEQALVEHVCSAKRVVGAPASDHEACLAAELNTLRADFGRDLKQLSSAERRSLDSVCSKLRAAEGRDAYVACLNTQLVALRARRGRANPAPADAAASAPAASLPPPSTLSPNLRQSSWTVGWWIGGGVVVLIIAAVGVVAVKSRRRVSTCRECGARFPEPGDLCQKCRHEAAEAARRAALERAEAERAHNAEAQRQQDREEELRREQLRRLEEEQALHQERLRREERARQEAEARRLEEEARQRRESAAAAQAFDPHAVLGVAPGASAEAITAAYEAAKAKYDPEQVSHLSEEVQQHYQAKAEAVQQAYQALIRES